ncbi:DUF397 domain-containing protein [Streptomyces sp. NRRL B-1677]|uniref:DUF397 domain-containing protein n=2 Tax=Streptomyces TaxID=1883 RepID=A0A3B0AZJ0_9ACTN|nr:DUF397 domain-containing protein [Streptomyces klenkii]MBF6048560.1 DUF397 domain-containing protein [Streptomyces sp. NRRL B-1677]RKN65704.1 DUF397 domain-containing protein [Streptomyces klenkii]
MNWNDLAWRKSSYSGHQTDCVEAAEAPTDTVAVRDSKASHGPTLILPARAWAAFVSHVKGAGLPR